MKRIRARVQREAVIVEQATITLSVPGFLSDETQATVMREYLESLDAGTLAWSQERYLIEDRPKPVVISVRQVTGDD